MSNSDQRSNVADLDVPPLLARLTDDPWSLSHGERHELETNLAAEQAAWLPRIHALVEPPAVDASFPAFLLATPPFAHLARAIGDAPARWELDTGTADELQRFVDRYRGFLTEDR